LELKLVRGDLNIQLKYYAAIFPENILIAFILIEKYEKWVYR